ncbi:MAG: hypothetical protein WC699_05260 [Bacteroidales bacterium]|jgi:hypothetical protein
MAKKTLALVFLFFPLLLPAQSIKDTTLQLHMFSFHVSSHLPTGDIASRYGFNMGAGGSYWLKTRSGWLFGIDYTYIFGNKFKEDSILNGIRDQSGYMITSYGEQMYPTISERGFYSGLKVGKLFPVMGPNKNSGLIFTAGAGLLQYKTFFRFEENTIPVMQGDYIKMFDYQTNGIALNQFIGYLHLDNDQPINFYAGFEFHQAWTICRRDWLYNLHGYDNTLRHDFLFGFKVGWIFPVGKKTTGTYTYF